VGTLVYFVGHISGRINVDTVIELVNEEVTSRSVGSPQLKSNLLRRSNHIGTAPNQLGILDADIFNISMLTGSRIGPQ
jgi:hypothetical protein